MEVVMMQDLNLPILKRGQTWLSEFPFQKSAYSFTAWTDEVGHTVGRVDRANQDYYHWIKGSEEQGGMGGMDTNEYDNDRQNGSREGWVGKVVSGWDEIDLEWASRADWGGLGWAWQDRHLSGEGKGKAWQEEESMSFYLNLENNLHDISRTFQD